MLGSLQRLLPYALAFFSSMCIMTLELVSSRLVAQHVGASLAVWTSVIGIILGGICLGNVLGGRLADRVEPAAGDRAALRRGLVPDALHALDEHRGRLYSPAPGSVSPGSCAPSWWSRWFS